MKTLDEKLVFLQNKLKDSEAKVRVMIFGLGSVGQYLLDYLVSTADPQLEIIVVGRNYDKMLSDVNIVKTAATIRRQLRCRIHIEGDCNLEDVDNITEVISKWTPDFIVNSSRVYSGLKYGSISWLHLRAYGIWTPLSVRFAKNIMLAYGKADSSAIAINTSYSDAVIPWLKSAGCPYFDFGSGNLNHLVPRMKFHIAENYGIDNLNDIDVTLAVSHFHDVVLSKEGHAEGQDILIDIKYKDKSIDFDRKKLFAACKIAMPVDQKRNMMNASSNFDIIEAVLMAIRYHIKVKVHTPGVDGEIGGYPFVIDGTGRTIKGYIDTSEFSLEEMREANRKSIYLDGIQNIEKGVLFYTLELVDKVKKQFGYSLIGQVHLDDSNEQADMLIKNIINPSL